MLQVVASVSSIIPNYFYDYNNFKNFTVGVQLNGKGNPQYLQKLIYTCILNQRDEFASEVRMH